MVAITWTPQSLEDIDNIAAFISIDSIKYANIQVDTFFTSTEILETNPKAGRIVPEYNKENVRELIVGSYRIIYRIKNTTSIEILTVHHSSRLLK
jgi:toxin ParE1/3/4